MILGRARRRARRLGFTAALLLPLAAGCDLGDPQFLGTWVAVGDAQPNEEDIQLTTIELTADGKVLMKTPGSRDVYASWKPLPDWHLEIETRSFAGVKRTVGRIWENKIQFDEEGTKWVRPDDVDSLLKAKVMKARAVVNAQKKATRRTNPTESAMGLSEVLWHQPSACQGTASNQKEGDDPRVHLSRNGVHTTGAHKKDCETFASFESLRILHPKGSETVTLRGDSLNAELTFEEPAAATAFLERAAAKREEWNATHEDLFAGK